MDSDRKITVAHMSDVDALRTEMNHRFDLLEKELARRDEVFSRKLAEFKSEMVCWMVGDRKSVV